MVETIRIPPPRRKPSNGLVWTWKVPAELPSPFDEDYRWQLVPFNLDFEVTKSPESHLVLFVESLNQLVVFQLPRPVKKGFLRKKLTKYSTNEVIEQAFTKPSTKFSFRCYYRRNWALSEGLDRAVLNYTFRIGEGKQTQRSGPHQIVIPIARKKSETS